MLQEHTVLSCDADRAPTARPHSGSRRCLARLGRSLPERQWLPAAAGAKAAAVETGCDGAAMATGLDGGTAAHAAAAGAGGVDGAAAAAAAVASSPPIPLMPAVGCCPAAVSAGRKSATRQRQWLLCETVARQLLCDTVTRQRQ